MQQAIETLGFGPRASRARRRARAWTCWACTCRSTRACSTARCSRRSGASCARSSATWSPPAAAPACGDARLQALDGIDFLRQRECDGLLLMSHALHDDDLRQLHAQMPQIAVLNRIVPGLESVCFSSDHALGGRPGRAVPARGRAPRGRHHQRPAPRARQNGRGCTAFSTRSARPACGCPPERIIITGDFTPASGGGRPPRRCWRAAARRPALLGAVLRQRPDNTIAAISVLAAAGLRVPRTCRWSAMTTASSPRMSGRRSPRCASTSTAVAAQATRPDQPLLRLRPPGDPRCRARAGVAVQPVRRVDAARGERPGRTVRKTRHQPAGLPPTMSTPDADLPAPTFLPHLPGRRSDPLLLRPPRRPLPRRQRLLGLAASLVGGRSAATSTVPRRLEPGTGEQVLGFSAHPHRVASRR